MTKTMVTTSLSPCESHSVTLVGADVALQDPLVWGDFRDALDILVGSLSRFFQRWTGG